MIFKIGSNSPGGDVLNINVVLNRWVNANGVCVRLGGNRLIGNGEQPYLVPWYLLRDLLSQLLNLSVSRRTLNCATGFIASNYLQ